MTFKADLTKWVQKAKGKQDAVVRKIVIDLGKSIIMKNPVGDGKYWKMPVPKGYVGGRSRANWMYGNGVMPSGAVDNIDPSGSKTIAKLVAQVSSTPTASVHWIANSLPYIRRLEEGWSRQAPQGMVRLTIEEFQQTVRKAANSIR